MGSKLSCAPWRIPGCLCSCQINSPVTAVMFNIPSHYLAGIPGLLQGLQPGPSHIFPPVLVPLAGLQQHERAFLNCSLIQGLGEEAASRAQCWFHHRARLPGRLLPSGSSPALAGQADMVSASVLSLLQLPQP